MVGAITEAHAATSCFSCYSIECSEADSELFCFYKMTLVVKKKVAKPGGSRNM